MALDIDKLKIDSNRVKAARTMKGKNQSDVAGKLKIDKTTYSKKENGVIEFKIKEGIVMADYLEIDFFDIFNYEEVEYNSTEQSA